MQLIMGNIIRQLESCMREGFVLNWKDAACMNVITLHTLQWCIQFSILFSILLSILAQQARGPTKHSLILRLLVEWHGCKAIPNIAQPHTQLGPYALSDTQCAHAVPGHHCSWSTWLRPCLATIIVCLNDICMNDAIYKNTE